MPKFYNNDMAELAHQLTISPRRLRMKQIRGIERLYSVIEPEKAYPFEFICHAITEFRKRGGTTGPLVPGRALQSDLATMADCITRRSGISTDELEEPFRTHQEVARHLGVSTKTIRRWRNRGLMGLRAVFGDGVNRLVFLNSTIDRFVEQNQALVAKGSAFKQLSVKERKQIVERAREILTRRPLRLHAVAKLLADETGRAVETIRYTLRRYDASHQGSALFSDQNRSLLSQRFEAIWRCHETGEGVACIARAFDCTDEEIAQILRHVQVLNWKEKPFDLIHNELFDAPGADALILEAEEPAAPQRKLAKIPADLPSYLQSLYRTPLLTREQEADLFRRYNYLKYKINQLLKRLVPETATEVECREVRQLIRRIEVLQQRIVRANLRLVVSVAKKHVGWSASFFEVISDGNMSLMRAVEKFDYARGNKFSTYATWAIVKNYARSIPEEHYHCARYVTGQDTVLELAPDPSEAQAFESDKKRVRELLTAGLDELPEREREIVRGHFGLGAQGNGLTLEQLGRRFGVTKERVRQIEQRAFSRLRELLAPSLAE